MHFCHLGIQDILNPFSERVPIHAFASSHGHTVGLQAGIKIAQTDATGAALFSFRADFSR